MNSLTTDSQALAEIGVELGHAIHRDINTKRLRRYRKLMLVALVSGVLLAVGGVALSATLGANPTPTQEQQGLLDGHAVFNGTNPTCVQTGNEAFHCTLQRAPNPPFIEGSYRGAIVQTVDVNKRVNGACIAVSDDGMAWDCYLGQVAVTHGIADSSLFGTYQPGPGHG